MTKVLSMVNKMAEIFEKQILSWTMIVLAALTVGNVLSRKIFNFSWSFTEEISQFILVLVTFLGSSYGARKARHICMTALVESLNEKWQKIFIIVSSLFTALVLFYLSYLATEYVVSTYAMQKTTPVLRIPFYLVIVCVPVGLFLTAVQYLLTFAKNIAAPGVWHSFEHKAEFQKLPSSEAQGLKQGD